MTRILLALCACAVLLAAELSTAAFRHHHIFNSLPGKNVGIGSSAAADFDKDGDIDFACYNRGDGKLYWFEQQPKGEWVQHAAGEFVKSQLGAAALDVDGDGWTDLLVGGYWFRNPGDPRTKPFERFQYDSRIVREIHDIVLADMDGDGKQDIVVSGDGDGCFWYSIPDKPARDGDWPRTTITLSVRTDRDRIHSGFNPGGVGDLDGDGDNDVYLTDRWVENRGQGKEWAERRVPFGRKGTWGVSGRSWIADLDGDGDNDIVVADSDGQNSGVAWLENDGRKPPNFRTHYLANRASGTRGSFHSLRMADFDGDGDLDILVIEQEDPTILPLGATPRWYIWENQTVGRNVRFEERVIFDGRLGGHDAFVVDMDGDGDLDIVSKIWSVWPGNANGGKVHADWLENLAKSPR